jgi:DNA-binding MarR family transcriptional regulator
MSRGSRIAALGALNAELRGWQVDQEIFDGSVAKLARLNRTQWRCLDILTTRGPLTAGKLAEATRLTTGAVTAAVDLLENAHLVRRVRDLGDRRRVIIEPTEEVARRAAPVYGPLTEESDRALAAFSVGDLEVIQIRARSRRLLEHPRFASGDAGSPNRLIREPGLDRAYRHRPAFDLARSPASEPATQASARW